MHRFFIQFLESLFSLDLLCLQVSSGHLLAAVSQHYQPVSVLCFIDDGTHFISGGGDARVIVWRLGRCVCVFMCECVCVCVCVCVCGCG